jgi:hypothetical protein
MHFAPPCAGGNSESAEMIRVRTGLLARCSVGRVRSRTLGHLHAVLSLGNVPRQHSYGLEVLRDDVIVRHGDVESSFDKGNEFDETQGVESAIEELGV